MPGTPKTMRAAAIDRFGGPEVLTIHTLPVREIGPQEIRSNPDTWVTDRWSGTGERGGVSVQPPAPAELSLRMDCFWRGQ
jgi:NADPH2:quinone reductase